MTSKIYTTEELESFLVNEAKSIVAKEKIPQAVMQIEDIERADHLAVSMLGQMGGFLGAKGVMECNAYWEIRDKVHDYQRQYNVSGLTIDEALVGGRVVKYPQPCSQLILLLDDHDVLKAFAPRAVDLFKEFAKEHGAYVYINQNVKGGGDWQVETTISYIEHHASVSEWARFDYYNQSSLNDHGVMLELGWGDIEAAAFTGNDDGDSVIFRADVDCKL